MKFPNTLSLAVIGLTAIAITALLTGHDGTLVSSIVGTILIISGYAISQRRNGNGNNNAKN